MTVSIFSSPPVAEGFVFSLFQPFWLRSASVQDFLTCCPFFFSGYTQTFAPYHPPRWRYGPGPRRNYTCIPRYETRVHFVSSIWQWCNPHHPFRPRWGSSVCFHPRKVLRHFSAISSCRKRWVYIWFERDSPRPPCSLPYTSLDSKLFMEQIKQDNRSDNCCSGTEPLGPYNKSPHHAKDWVNLFLIDNFQDLNEILLLLVYFGTIVKQQWLMKCEFYISTFNIHKRLSNIVSQLSIFLTVVLL